MGQAATGEASRGTAARPAPSPAPKSAPKPATPKPATAKPATVKPATGSSATPSRAAATATATTAYTSLLGTVLREGSRGAAVRTLQRGLGGLAVDGVFGARTSAAVTGFQRAHHLKATGVVDRAVWKALEAKENPLLAYRGTVLRTGSRGTAVVALQRALRIPADGVFGPQTQAAVKALQRRTHLASTGVVASLTWQALERELRR